MFFLAQNLFVYFLAYLIFKDSIIKLLNCTVENVILYFAIEVAVILGASIPTESHLGQSYINVLKESLKF